eukprot:scaffold2149_cov187-Cylindrotheca_fusiformis.AAC.28
MELNTALNILRTPKGLYVKDFVPPQYIELFISAQDSIPQWPADDIVNVIDATLKSEFGLTFDDVFQSLVPSALGSASIGQVHKAKLKSKYANLEGYGGGEVVAVKVFRWFCRVALKGWEPILDECYRQIMSEFDYRHEAGSLARVRENMAKSPFHRKIRIPEPLSKLCTKELLIMEMLEGEKLSDSIENDLGRILGGKDKAQILIARKRLGEYSAGDEALCIYSPWPCISRVLCDRADTWKGEAPSLKEERK